MTTYAPLFNSEPPEFRVLYRASFGASEGPTDDASISATDWTTLVQPPDIATGGVELIHIRRRSLPEIGTAEFRYLYGKFAGGNIIKGPDLKRWEVRLQLRPFGSTDEADWKTEFWGYVDVQEDQFLAGSTTAQGSTVYRCVDGFARATKWFMNRHGMDGRLANVGGDVYVRPELYGNPGYNYQLATDGPVLGNKSRWSYQRGSSLVMAHTWQGAFASADPNNNLYKWSEWDAILHACRATRPTGEPEFKLLEGSAEGYGMFNPIDVNPSTSVFDFVTGRTRRNRGLGVVTPWWVDKPSGAIQVGFKVTPPYKDNVFYADPVTGAASYGYVTGSDSAGTTYLNEAGLPLLVLQGNHQVIDRMMNWSDSETHLHDYVETVGEQMEIVVTLSYKNNTDKDYYDPAKTKCLQARWSSTDATSFEALPTKSRIMQYWDFVWQSHGLPRDWYGQAGDGYTLGTSHRVDWSCADDGTLFVPGNAEAYIASACMVEVQGSLPFYQGYKYDGATPVRTDNSQQQGAPSRRPMVVYLNLVDTSDRWYLPNGQMPSDLPDPKFTPQAAGFSPEVTIHSDAMMVMSRLGMELGLRYFANKASAIGSIYDVSQLAFTVSLKMPYRVRMCTTTVSTDAPNLPAGKLKDWKKAKRSKTVYVPGTHLWLADYQAIYDLKQNDYVVEQGFAPLRGALGSTNTAPALLRDDRRRLVIYHTMIATWYMTPRRRVVFGFKTCALMNQQMIKDGNWATPVSFNFPKMGDYQHQLSASGQTLDVGTVVTGIDYEHQAGETRFETDWYDIEVA